MSLLTNKDFALLQRISNGDNQEPKVLTKHHKRLFRLGLICRKDDNTLYPLSYVRSLAPDLYQELTEIELLDQCYVLDNLLLVALGFVSVSGPEGRVEITKTGRYALKRIRKLEE